MPLETETKLRWQPTLIAALYAAPTTHLASPLKYSKVSFTLAHIKKNVFLISVPHPASSQGHPPLLRASTSTSRRPTSDFLKGSDLLVSCARLDAVLAAAQRDALVSHDTFERQHSVDVPGICDAIYVTGIPSHFPVVFTFFFLRISTFAPSI